MNDKLPENNRKNEDLTEDDYSLMILKNRLAKGEITLDEFETLRKKLIESDTVTRLKDEIKNINEKMEKISKEQGSTQAIANKIRQYKSVGVTAVLAGVLGIFGVWGIGHFYIGEKRKGLAFFMTGLFLVIWIILLLLGATYWTNGNIETIEQFTFASAVGLILGIPYIILYVIQIITAIHSCQKHNRCLDQIGSRY
jgi:uncharacterized membrane protein (DUF485 family)